MQRSLTVHRSPVLLTILILCIGGWLLPTAVHADPADGDHLVFLPVVAGEPSAPPSCELNAAEARINELLLSHPNQGRITLVCNPTLSAVARARAADMGNRAYFSHVNPDGEGPNYIVRQAGYTLPGEYSTEIHGNNIESIGAGASGADDMWTNWMQSSKHVSHLLGENDFFAQQIEYGIGFAQVPGSPYQFYWVFISSKPVQ